MQSSFSAQVDTAFADAFDGIMDAKTPEDVTGILTTLVSSLQQVKDRAAQEGSPSETKILTRLWQDWQERLRTVQDMLKWFPHYGALPDTTTYTASLSRLVLAAPPPLLD